MLRNRGIGWVLALGVSVAVLGITPTHARAISLADLDAGALFTMGPLTFSNFDVSVTGDLSMDLDGYDVQILMASDSRGRFRWGKPSPESFC
jgi:hypothetical protein